MFLGGRHRWWKYFTHRVAAALPWHLSGLGPVASSPPVSPGDLELQSRYLQTCGDNTASTSLPLLFDTSRNKDPTGLHLPQSHSDVRMKLPPLPPLALCILGMSLLRPSFRKGAGREGSTEISALHLQNDSGGSAAVVWLVWQDREPKGTAEANSPLLFLSLPFLQYSTQYTGLENNGKTRIARIWIRLEQKCCLLYNETFQSHSNATVLRCHPCAALVR